MNESTAEGFLNETKGKLKQAVGETFDNQKIANEGAADEVKGHAQQTWGSVKDTAHDLGNENRETTAATTSNTGHDLRTSITSAAEKVKDSIQHGLDHIEHHDKQ